MNYYESKMLEDRAHRLISTGVALTVFALPIAAVFAAFIAIITSSASSIPLYIAWGLFELLGIGGIATGVKEKIDLKRNQHS